MQAKTLMRVAVTTFVAVLTIAVQPSAQSQSYTTFDPAGSQATLPVSINPSGAITGSYVDSSLVSHGFLRHPDGTITTFDAPGAGTEIGQGTVPAVITPQGLIVGTYFFSPFASQIFLRAKDGTITNLELPSTASVGGGLTANTEGEIAGEFSDSSDGLAHGFLRATSGKVTVFDIPVAFQLSFFAPSLVGISADGTIVGSYTDSSGVAHGFLRARNGTYTTFDIPNASPDFGTNPMSINDSGTVTGYYADTTQNSQLRVFLLSRNGAVSTFALPETGFFWNAASINSFGAVTGNFVGAAGTVSFLRTPFGSVKEISDPKAVQGGTQAVSINVFGQITGSYLDGSGAPHGFLRNPSCWFGPENDTPEGCNLAEGLLGDR